jgi:PDZ domain
MFVLLLMTTGCAQHRPSIYENWGEQLSSRSMSLEDTSLMLGTAPIKCEPFEPKPFIGIRVKEEDSPPIVLATFFNGPAFKAGVRENQVLTKVNGKPVGTGAEVYAAITKEARWGEKFTIETTSGYYSLILIKPTIAKQCYWEVTAGSVASSGGAGYVNQYAGFSSHNSNAYQRFFRTSCRFYNTDSIGCKSNWQQ